MTTISTRPAVASDRRTPDRPFLLGVATASPELTYTQDELLDRFEVESQQVRSIFANSHIERRHFFLPHDTGSGPLETESQAELLDRHRSGAVALAASAVDRAVRAAGLDLADVDYLCVVTTTGFTCPGLSAHLISELGLDPSTSRVDVVGMGCNAGLNALNPVVSWAAANPGRHAVQVCVEVCSAAYVFDETLRTAVVNSLFGDGAAAVVVGTDPAIDGGQPLPRVLDFSSHVLTSHIDAMRFDWDDVAGRFSFYLDPAIPYVVGANAAIPVGRLLGAHGLRIEDVDHWVVHTGGKKVIDGVKYNLDLVDHDLRHTGSVLRDHGNLSSGSFLYSYERLVQEGVARHGDTGVMMTMGPGTTIETALIAW